VIGGLNMFINRIVRYIDLGGLHAQVIGVLNVFMIITLVYVDLGGLHARVIWD